VSDERLTNLLKDADRYYEPRRAAADLEQRVTHAVRRARRIEVGVGLAAAAALLLAVYPTLRVVRTAIPPKQTARAEPLAANEASLRAEIASLRQEAEMHRGVALRILANRALRASSAHLKRTANGQSSSTARQIERQVDRAAELVVKRAARLMQASETCDAAAELRRVIKLFPESPWAEVARRRLGRIKPESST